jgi:hypothetical protein
MTDSDPRSLLIVLTLIVLALISYLLPTIVATIRRHADKGAIFVINLFLGWSLIGWVAALAWASKGIKTTTTAEVGLRPIRRTLWRWLSMKRLNPHHASRNPV